MLTAYINEAMTRANYKILNDGTYFGEIPDLQGVWANAATLEHCRRELQEVLEGWLILKIRDSESIPALGRASIHLDVGTELQLRPQETTVGPS